MEKGVRKGEGATEAPKRRLEGMGRVVSCEMRNVCNSAARAALRWRLAAGAPVESCDRLRDILRLDSFPPKES